MLICYNAHTGKSPAPVKKQLLGSIFLLIALFSIPFSSAAQVQETPSADIIALLNQRTALIGQGASTRELDRQIYDLGYRPKAVTATQTLENGTKRVVFPIYLVVSEEKKDRIVQRLTAYYSYLNAMEIDVQQKQVAIIVPAETTAGQLDDIFTHFGYLGHEEH